MRRGGRYSISQTTLEQVRPFLPNRARFTTELCKRNKTHKIATFRSSFNRGAGQFVADGSTQRESPQSAVLKRACTRARARVCVQVFLRIAKKQKDEDDDGEGGGEGEATEPVAAAGGSVAGETL